MSRRVLECVFAACEQVYDPTSGPRRPAVACGDIRVDEAVHRWYSVAGRTKMTCSPALDSPPTLVATLDLPVILRVMARVSHGVVEIVTGRLRFSGNLETATALDSWVNSAIPTRPGPSSGPTSAARETSVAPRGPAVWAGGACAVETRRYEPSTL
ncbi:MAG TPA: hypothetical protein VF364_09225 [Candidatus Limnocylindria bacterium]